MHCHRECSSVQGMLFLRTKRGNWILKGCKHFQYVFKLFHFFLFQMKNKKCRNGWNFSPRLLILKVFSPEFHGDGGSISGTACIAASTLIFGQNRLPSKWKSFLFSSLLVVFQAAHTVPCQIQSMHFHHFQHISIVCPSAPILKWAPCEPFVI